jgi:hypothetical protein
MKLRWSSIDGTSWRAMTENEVTAEVKLVEDNTPHYSLRISNLQYQDYHEDYIVANRDRAETILLERAGLL